MKNTKRTGFNFLRSYFDVLNKIKTDSEKLSFLLSIINKQFLNQDPENLSDWVEMAYEGQRHAIEKSVKGWIRVNNGNPPSDTLSDPPLEGGYDPLQVEEEEEEKEEVPITKAVLIEDKHREFSLKFYQQLKERGVISKLIKVNDNLIHNIRKLETVDQIKWSDITNGANYYFNNLDVEFMPEIQSTKSFRDKFDKLVAHKKRQP